MRNYIVNLFGFLFVISLSQPVNAQGGGNGVTISPSDVSYSGLGSGTFNDWMIEVDAAQTSQGFARSLYAKVDGSPYFFDDYQEGVVITIDDQAIVDVKLNYDSYRGNVIAINEKDEEISLAAKYYKKVIFKALGGDIIFARVNPESPMKFVQVLYDHKGIVFYKDLRTSIRKTKETGIGDAPDRFVRREFYYVVKDGGPPVAVNLKKRNLFEHFEETEMTKINSLLKKKRNKLKNEDDYMALFSELLEVRL